MQNRSSPSPFTNPNPFDYHVYSINVTIGWYAEYYGHVPQVVLYSTNEQDAALFLPVNIGLAVNESSFASMQSKFTYSDTSVFTEWLRDYIYFTENNLAQSECPSPPKSPPLASRWLII